MRAECKNRCICDCCYDEEERNTYVDVVDMWMPIGWSRNAGGAIAVVRNIIVPSSEASSENTKVTNEEYSPNSYKNKSGVPFQTTFVKYTCTSCAIRYAKLICSLEHQVL
jgi:hypothetical protein